MSESTNLEKSTNKPLQGSTKLKNYFLDLIKSAAFQNEITRIRTAYNIPKNGFEVSEKHSESDYAPKYPTRWSQPSGEVGDGFWLEFFSKESNLCEQFKIPPSNLDILDHYIMYNEVISSNEIAGLCLTQDCHDIGSLKEIDEEYSEGFPILIRISPYAGQRDILDYIKKSYTQKIKPLQDKYRNEKIMLGRTRSKNEDTQERNDFIYKHKNLPLKEIRKILSEKKIFLDDGHIGKIISLETDKRR